LAEGGDEDIPADFREERSENGRDTHSA
jgi:hypothetical protein